MAKRSMGLTTVGYGLSVIYGVGLMTYLYAFVISFSNEQAVLSSSLFTGKFQNIAEFQRHAVIFWALFFPQFIGLIAVLMLKDWGRKLVIFMNILLSLYFFFIMVFESKSVDLRNLSLVLIYVSVILFFSWSKIKEQFQNAAKRKVILIVDDDKGLLKMMKVNLATHGFDVLTAFTGEKGLEMAQKMNPDLIILDVILPGIKGREVCAKLKRNPKTQSIPVMFLTAKNSPDDVKAELELGAVTHLTKPLDSHKVLEEIRHVLKITTPTP